MKLFQTASGTFFWYLEKSPGQRAFAPLLYPTRLHIGKDAQLFLYSHHSQHTGRFGTPVSSDSSLPTPPGRVARESVCVCCLLVLNSVTSTPQWIRQPEAAWGHQDRSPDSRGWWCTCCYQCFSRSRTSGTPAPCLPCHC